MQRGTVLTPRYARKFYGGPPEPDRVMLLRWPWWVHPAWAALLLTGLTAAVAISLPASVYAEAWRVPKFLDPELALVLVVGVVALFAGIMLTGVMAARSGQVTLTFTAHQIAFLRRAYRLLLTLTVLGYLAWAAAAIIQGVGPDDLLAVVQREEGAISRLKGNARPIAGLTTLTQFGPAAATIGYLLRKLGLTRRRLYLIVVVLAFGRSLFYAERLALLEVLIPLLLVASLTVDPAAGKRRLVRLAPVIVAPLVWLVFAASEYTRSWIFYQQTTGASFVEWVTLRLIGYYTTSFNNSALLAISHDGVTAPPYFSIPALWNAPGMAGSAPDMSAWWTQVLVRHTNPEFTNVGSFLPTYAELGLIGMIAFWLAVGAVLGAMFSGLSKGSVPALIGYSTLFVGVLELPRFIYWTQGRATPVILAAILIALLYPRARPLGSAPQS